MNAKKLLQDLLETTRENLNAAEYLKGLPMETLNWKQNPTGWSALECVEHLNRYGDFYIPELTQRIAAPKHQSSGIFKSNWLGNYFTKAVSYTKDMNKMKTFKAMNPLNSELNIQTLEKFIAQQHQLIELLNKSKSIDLDRTKTSISISKWIKLKLGDTFRVVIYHNERHIKQAEKAVREANL